MIWIAVAAVLVGLALSLLWRERRNDAEDYDTVSGAWIAAHRASDDQER
jgi:hypothetical protein